MPIVNAISPAASSFDAATGAAALPVRPTWPSILAQLDLQVRQKPGKVAARDGQRSLTYAELAAQSDLLAHSLALHGIRPGSRVGIGIDHSLEMIVAIFGVLKATAAYVPVDPAYPTDRLRLIVEDSGVSVVLTRPAVVDRLAALPVHLLNVELATLSPGAVSSGRSAVIPGEDSAAIIIYTSGSTGTPKGVVISHGNLAHFVRIVREALAIRPNDIWLQTASISYALQIRQLMTPLSIGATVVLANEDDLHDPRALFELVAAEGVTLMDFVPSHWRACNRVLAQMPAPERSRLLDNRLRQIVSIGEPLTWDVVRMWREEFRHPARLVNIFGQTETTGMVASHVVPPVLPMSDGLVPVGKPVRDTQIHLLDANDRPVADGEVGEIFVSNPCVAQGYWNRPTLTAEKFLPSVTAGDVCGRIYRTGDLARRDADGNLVHLGRMDQQVKIRGMRIDLCDIEASIRHLDAVQDAAVVAAPHDGESELEAYVAIGQGAALTAQGVRSFLRSRLPAHMVPRRIHMVTGLPYLPNGKLDRKTLMQLTAAKACGAAAGGAAACTAAPTNGAAAQTRDSIVESAETLVAPRTAIERTLAALWSQALRVDSVGIYDDFFELGGDSLLAVRTTGQINETLGLKLRAGVLFEAPTIAQLAERLADPLSWSKEEIVVPMQKGNGDLPLFLVHGLGGSVLGYVDLIRALGPEQPVYGLQAVGLNDDDAPDASIEAMAGRYITAMRSVQSHGPYLLAGYCYGGVVAFEMARQLRAAGEQIGLLAILEGYPPGWREHRQPIFSPARLHLLRRSAPLWFSDYRGLGAAGLARRVQWKLQRWQDRSKPGSRACSVDPEEVVADDLSQLPEHRLQLLTAQLQAIRVYRPEPYQGDLILFRARGRTVSQALTGSVDLDLGWRRVVAGHVAVYEVAGSHRNLHLAPYAPALATALSACLAGARQNIFSGQSAPDGATKPD